MRRKVREKGRVSIRLGRIVLAAAIVVGGTFVLWPPAHATDSRAHDLGVFLESQAGESRKTMAIEELRKIDTSESRTILSNLAASKSDRVAMLALRALARADFSGARTTITGVFEDTARSDLARGTALAVWCQLRKTDGASWSDIRTYVHQKAGTNTHLCALYGALVAKLWPSEVSNV